MRGMVAHGTKAAAKCFAVLVVIGSALLFYNEYLIYYVVLSRCAWPAVPAAADLLVADNLQANYNDDTPVHAMLLADTHLLGHFRGHWFDKMRREWQMYRSFQTALWVHQPDIVFILGDLLDEGQYAHQNELFNKYVGTFRNIFNTTGRSSRSKKTLTDADTGKSIKQTADDHTIPLYTVVGNHDIGFHYRIYDAARHRFQKTFNAPGVRLLRFRQVLFVLLNSMAMEEDGCSMCADAEKKLQQISDRLQCSIVREMGYNLSLSGDRTDANSRCPYPISPMSNVILLQHFPLYRTSEAAVCDMQEADAAPASLRNTPYVERKDCLSRSATDKVLQLLKLRAVFAGHSHQGCFRVHDDGTREWTVASFSWRNRINPNFLLVTLTRTQLAVSKCYVPYESTVIGLYVVGVVIWGFISWQIITGRRLGVNIIPYRLVKRVWFGFCARFWAAQRDDFAKTLLSGRRTGEKLK